MTLFEMMAWGWLVAVVITLAWIVRHVYREEMKRQNEINDSKRPASWMPPRGPDQRAD